MWSMHTDHFLHSALYVWFFLPSHISVLPELCHLPVLSARSCDSPQTLSEDTFLFPSNFVFYFRFFSCFFKSVIYQEWLKFKNIIESHHHHQHGNGFKRKLARSVLVLPASTRMSLNVKWQFNWLQNCIALAFGTESIIPLFPDLCCCHREVCCRSYHLSLVGHQVFLWLLHLIQTLYWYITYRHKNVRFISLQLDEFSQREHKTHTQNKGSPQ